MVTYRTVWSPWPRCLSRAGIAGDSTDQSWDLIPLEPGGPGKSGRKAYASALPRRCQEHLPGLLDPSRFSPEPKIPAEWMESDLCWKQAHSSPLIWGC